MKRKQKRGCGPLGCFAVVGLLMLCAGLGQIREGLLTPAQRAERDKRENEASAAEKVKADRQAAEDAARQEKEDRKEKDRIAANNEKWDAIFAAQEFVKRGLTHPSTATFPRGTPEASKASDGAWLVSGTVKAKNSFNLEITLRYRCRVRRAEKEWVLVDREMSE